MMTSEALRERLKSSTPSPSSRKVLKLLSEDLTRPVSAVPATVTVSEALRLWRTRLKNTRYTDAPLKGVQDLLKHLEELAPQRKLDQFGFVSPQAAVTVFFTRTDGAYVGSAILDKRDSR
jgi:hypothetical protein